MLFSAYLTGMNEHLQLLDPKLHLGERWPARLWTRCAVSGLDAAGTPRRIVFFAPWQPVYVYNLGFEDQITGQVHVPDPAPDAATFTRALLTEAHRAGASALTSIRTELFDGYYYDPAAYVARTFTQDKTAALALFPEFEVLLTNRAPAAPATV